MKKTWLLYLFLLSLSSAIFAEEKWASAAINVRTGPGSNYEIMGQLYKNERIEIFDVINGWAQILFEDIEGYVKEDLLLSERIKTPEEEEEARIAAELEKKRQEEEQKKLRLQHIIKFVLFIAIGLIGFRVIFFPRRRN